MANSFQTNLNFNFIESEIKKNNLHQQNSAVLSQGKYDEIEPQVFENVL